MIKLIETPFNTEQVKILSNRTEINDLGEEYPVAVDELEVPASVHHLSVKNKELYHINLNKRAIDVYIYMPLTLELGDMIQLKSGEVYDILSVNKYENYTHVVASR